MESFDNLLNYANGFCDCYDFFCDSMVEKYKKLADALNNQTDDQELIKKVIAELSDYWRYNIELEKIEKNDTCEICEKDVYWDDSKDDEYNYRCKDCRQSLYDPDTTIVYGIICKSCNNTLQPHTMTQHLNGDFNKVCPHK